MRSQWPTYQGESGSGHTRPALRVRSAIFRTSSANNIPTAGVGPNGIGIELVVNPDFYKSLSEEHRMGLLKHELLHVSFGHIATRDRYPDKKLANIAMDIEINQYIDPNYLPPGGLTLDTFPELDLPERAGTKYYYDELQNAADQGTCQSLQQLLDDMDGESQYCHKTCNRDEK